jgi:hypothetical protein
MSEAKTYAGSCHCGAVKFEVTGQLDSAISCNCSMCLRRGGLLTFVSPQQFKLLAGEAAQTDYQFNRKNIHHLFCATCGVFSFGHGTGPKGDPMYAVNVRCLEGVDIGQLKVTPVDGRSF